MESCSSPRRIAAISDKLSTQRQRWLSQRSQDASTTEANEDQEQQNIARALANVEEEQRGSGSSFEGPSTTTSTRPSSSSSRRSREERTTATVSSQTVPVVQLPSTSQYPWASVDRIGKEGMTGVRYLHAGVPSLVPHSARMSASQIVPRAVIPMSYVSQSPAVLSRGIPLPSSASGGPTTTYQYPVDSRTVPVVLSGSALPITSSASSRQIHVRSSESSKANHVSGSTPAHLEEHIRDEEEWLSGGTSSSRSSGGASDDRSPNKEDKKGKDVATSSRLEDHHQMTQSVLFNQMGVCWDAQQLWTRIQAPYQRAAPVAVRPLIRVRAQAPTEEDSNDSTEGEAATRQVLSQLSL
ncbi:hypothetical protein CBR_g8357 [Chara braunii]|uniref:Uncharacterized protein n=1 Tax=Chara braunii TaxID=69332 RepID=A0A388KM40_CHABU|nr:hypothetical protein CBR_g8357 [Chara braunii]|eukprot:GBG71058.1 hypothetical protein CBR_g8357 [Chara braunii]